MKRNGAITLLVYLFCISINRVGAAIFEFGTTVKEVTVELSDGDDPNEAVMFVYEYVGPMPTEDGLVEIEYEIYEPGCSTLYASFTDNTKALFFNRTVEDTAANNVTVFLSMDLETISSSPLWTSLNATHAELAFCGRFVVNYDSVFVNFHETDLTVTVDVVSNSTFESQSVSLDMVQAGEVGQVSEVALDYPVQVYHCDSNAIALETPPTEATQGNAIQLCISLSTTQQGVYVDTIYSMTYWSELYPGAVSTIVSAGAVTNGVTQLDCTQVAGVCRIKFIASGNIFNDNPQGSNSLVIDGEATIGVGTDTRRRLVQLNGMSSTGKGRTFRSHFHLNLRNISSNDPVVLVVWTISLGNILFGMSICWLMVCLHRSYERRETRRISPTKAPEKSLQERAGLVDEDLV